MKLLLSLLSLVLAVAAQQQQQQQYTTPVPILKQINRHNEDGSYSYGYEAADGSFKIESKYPTGEVYGKYGYVDDQGQLREVEYGATKRGFEPSGAGIKVAPPTINTKNENYPPLKPGEEDDGQYREDPSIYYKDSRYNSEVSNSLQQAAPQPQQPRPVAAPAYNKPQRQSFFTNAAPAPVAEHRPEEEYYQQPQTQQYYQPQARVQQYYQQPQPKPQQQYYQPQQQQQSYQPRAPVVVDMNLFRGHPATNFDVNTGSYTINYSG